MPTIVIDANALAFASAVSTYQCYPIVLGPFGNRPRPCSWLVVLILALFFGTNYQSVNSTAMGWLFPGQGPHNPGSTPKIMSNCGPLQRHRCFPLSKESPVYIGFTTIPISNVPHNTCLSEIWLRFQTNFQPQLATLDLYLRCRDLLLLIAAEEKECLPLLNLFGSLDPKIFPRTFLVPITLLHSAAHICETWRFLIMKIWEFQHEWPQNHSAAFIWRF